MRKTVYLIIGLLAGAAVGAATTILLTPYSGQEMQSRIRTRAQGLIEEGKKAAAARRAELQAQLESFKRGGTSVAIDKTKANQPSA